MATVTGLTADRMLAIEAESIVDGDVVGDNLILTRHDGTQINAGSVRGPQGDQGPVGSMLAVLAAQKVSDFGIANQIRAGRQLGPADFANIGVSAPLGLWNLGDLTDVSGNGRALSNKGATPFTSGVNGVANTAAQFSGSTGQALYIADAGAGDPFRIRGGTIGCWFKTAKRGTDQYMFSKWKAAGNAASWGLVVSSGNQFLFAVSADGVNAGLVPSVSDVADNKWHFGVVTIDGVECRIYVDSILENVVACGFPSLAGAPLNIGGASADGATATASPFYGRVDEAFVTTDVLSEDQIRNLYCARITHTLGVTPTRVSLNVRRRKRGAALVAADFPTQPLRLYNFSAGSFGDEGSNGVVLTNNGGVGVASGVDGSAGNAVTFTGGQSASSTDAALPAALAARSLGCWFKTITSAGSPSLIGWGAGGTSTCGADIAISSTGAIVASSGTDQITGPYVVDGLWHHAVEVEDNAAADGVKRKLYVDGKLVGGSLTMNAITLGGANRFRLGIYPDNTLPYVGQIDAAFVCDYALTPDQIIALFTKSSQALAPSPKNPGDHVEAMSATDLLAIFDTLEAQHTIDLGVAA